MNVVAISNRGKSTFFSSHGVVNVVVLKRKNILFCHDRGVVDVVAINVFFMKLNVNLIFFMIMAS